MHFHGQDGDSDYFEGTLLKLNRENLGHSVMKNNGHQFLCSFPEHFDVV